MQNFWEGAYSAFMAQTWLEVLALITGLLAVYWLIKESMYTWPAGIAYVLISLVVFYKIRLYGDLALHVVFGVLNVIGWIEWRKGASDSGNVGNSQNEKSTVGLPVTTLSLKSNALAIAASIGMWLLFYYTLKNVHLWFPALDQASLPAGDAATNALSVMAIILQVKKRLESWVYWLIVDVLATGIYTYKGLEGEPGMFFYVLLYFVYIGMAVAGFIAWRKSYAESQALSPSVAKH